MNVGEQGLKFIFHSCNLSYKLTKHLNLETPSHFCNMTKMMIFCAFQCLISVYLTYHALFRMCPIGLQTLFSLIIVAFGTFTILSFLTPDKVGFSNNFPSKEELC